MKKLLAAAAVLAGLTFPALADDATRLTPACQAVTASAIIERLSAETDAAYAEKFATLAEAKDGNAIMAELLSGRLDPQVFASMMIDSFDAVDAAAADVCTDADRAKATAERARFNEGLPQMMAILAMMKGGQSK